MRSRDPSRSKSWSEAPGSRGSVVKMAAPRALPLGSLASQPGRPPRPTPMALRERSKPVGRGVGTRRDGPRARDHTWSSSSFRAESTESVRRGRSAALREGRRRQNTAGTLLSGACVSGRWIPRERSHGTRHLARQRSRVALLDGEDRSELPLDEGPLFGLARWLPAWCLRCLKTGQVRPAPPSPCRNGTAWDSARSSARRFGRALGHRGGHFATNKLKLRRRVGANRIFSPAADPDIRPAVKEARKEGVD